MPRYKPKNYTCANCGSVEYYKTPQAYSAHLRRCRLNGSGSVWELGVKNAP